MGENYYNAIMNDSVVIRIDGVITDKTGNTYPIDYSNILNDSFSITKKLCDKNISLGSTNSASLKIGVYFEDDTIDRYRFIDGTIAINFSVVTNLDEIGNANIDYYDSGDEGDSPETPICFSNETDRIYIEGSDDEEGDDSARGTSVYLSDEEDGAHIDSGDEEDEAGTFPEFLGIEADGVHIDLDDDGSGDDSEELSEFLSIEADRIYLNYAKGDSEKPQPEWETINCGVFTITSATKKDSSIEFEAYDNMIKFNRAIETDFTDVKPYNIIATCCSKCGVPLLIAQESIESLPNGNRMVSLYKTDNQNITYTNVLSDILAVIGSYSYIDGTGGLVIKQYGSTPTRVIPDNWRFSYEAEDYDIEYSGLSYSNVLLNESSIVGDETKAVYNFGTNMFMQYGDAREIRTAYENLFYNSLDGLSYRPFTAKTPLDFSLSVGDIIKFTGLGADSSKVATITEITYNGSGSMILKCNAENYLIKSTSDTSSSSISYAVQSAYDNSISYINYENSTALSTTDEECTLCRFGITFSKGQCMVFGSVELEADSTLSTSDSSYDIGDSVATITYYVDSEEVDSTRQTLRDGYNTLSLMYRLIKDVEVTSARFSAKLTVDGGTARISPFASKWVAMAQASYQISDTLNIIQKLSDTVETIELGNVFNVNALSGSVSSSMDTPIKHSLSDNVTEITLSNSFSIDNVTDNVYYKTQS